MNFVVNDVPVSYSAQCFWHDNASKSHEQWPISYALFTPFRKCICKAWFVLAGTRCKWIKRMKGIIKIWWNLTSAPSFITLASFPSQSEGRIGIYGHVTGSTRRWSSERPREISWWNWRFYSVNCCLFCRLQGTDGYTGLYYSYWLCLWFASVEVHVELWSIRFMECCFEVA